MTSFENLPSWCCSIFVLTAWVPLASCCPVVLMSLLVFHRIVADRLAVYHANCELFREGMTHRRLPSLLLLLRGEARLFLTLLSLTGQLQR